VGSYTSKDIRRDNRIRHEEGCLVKEEQSLMPTTLATTVKHIHDGVPNPINSQLIAEFHEFMKDNGASQRHQNNNLKTIIAYAEFLGADRTFYQVRSDEDRCCNTEIDV